MRFAIGSNNEPHHITDSAVRADKTVSSSNTTSAPASTYALLIAAQTSAQNSIDSRSDHSDLPLQWVNCEAIVTGPVTRTIRAVSFSTIRARFNTSMTIGTRPRCKTWSAELRRG